MIIKNRKNCKIFAKGTQSQSSGDASFLESKEIAKSIYEVKLFAKEEEQRLA